MKSWWCIITHRLKYVFMPYSLCFDTVFVTSTQCALGSPCNTDNKYGKITSSCYKKEKEKIMVSNSCIHSFITDNRTLKRK